MPGTHPSIIPEEKSLDLVLLSNSTINSTVLYHLPPVLLHYSTSLSHIIACNAFIFGNCIYCGYFIYYNLKKVIVVCRFHVAAGASVLH